VLKQSILILTVLCGLLLSGCQSSSKRSVRTGPPKNDVEFAREAFQLLAEGDEAAAEMLDWERLKMIGIDVGAMYRQSSESDRQTFPTAFIKGYSQSFKGKGGSADKLSNWREQSRDGSNTVVVADVWSGQLLTMTVSHINGQQKVSTIDLK
jgi:hypothetical protein